MSKVFLKVSYPHVLPNGNEVESFSYFRQENGPFEILQTSADDDDYTCKFSGLHYVSLGNTHIEGTKGSICGTEITQEKYKLIKEEEVPKDLKE